MKYFFNLRIKVMAVFLRVLKNLVKTFIENDELKQFTCFGAI